MILHIHFGDVYLEPDSPRPGRDWYSTRMTLQLSTNTAERVWPSLGVPDIIALAHMSLWANSDLNFVGHRFILFIYLLYHVYYFLFYYHILFILSPVLFIYFITYIIIFIFIIHLSVFYFLF